MVSVAAASYPIRRLLVANRGEIACRVIRTAKRMNIETVAVYSEADRNSMHVQLADQAHQVGTGSEPQGSYLNQEELLNLARANKVSAIHPGYGFLSENAEFSARCLAERLVFVGPKPESIRSMGIKNESKRIMISAGVPVVPGYHANEQSNERLMAEAQAIGFPVLIKPVRGGGGKGMRIVRKPEEFLDALESSRRESLKAFNDQSMLLEKYIEKPRHIEVQVFSDTLGNYVYLFERDCSVQRRHQKIIEEAPAPGLDAAKRSELGELAVAAARAVDYVGAGTVEFIMDRESGQFYFMEMNTRLQVEHPITEMVTGTDLVEWQLRVASGEQLPKRQHEILLHGHAFEARIYAEDPRQNFLPQTGCFEFISLPKEMQEASGQESGGYKQALRLDTGFRQGDQISPFYDPMIAKLIVWGHTRDEALARLRRALGNYVVLGLPTNVSFLRQLASNESFRVADIGTDFIELHQAELFEDDEPCGNEARKTTLSCEQVAQIGASIFALLDSSKQCKNGKKKLAISENSELRNFRTIGISGRVYEFKGLQIPNVRTKFRVSFQTLEAANNVNFSGQLSIYDDDNQQAFQGNVCLTKHQDDACSDLRISVNEGRDLFSFSRRSPTLSSASETKLLLRNESQGETHEIKLRLDNSLLSAQQAAETSQQQSASGDPLRARAPMPGVIERLLVSVGDQVDEGQNLVVLSAMKMEYTIKSATSGSVTEVFCKQGDFVAKESLLVRLERTDQN